jgi:hypothetical protein
MTFCNTLGNRVDQALFQWSAGGYALPETAQFVFDAYQFDEHDRFGIVAISIDDIAQLFPGLSRGSNIAGADVSIYKHHGIALMASLFDFIAGARAGQAWSWVATIEDIAAYTQSGVTSKGFEDPAGTSQIHRPDIKQDGNVALITYRPSYDILVSSFLLIYLVKTWTSPHKWPCVFQSNALIKRSRRDVGFWDARTKVILRSEDMGFVKTAARPLRIRVPRNRIMRSLLLFGSKELHSRTSMGSGDREYMTHGSFEEFEDVILQGEVSRHSSEKSRMVHVHGQSSSGWQVPIQ